MAALLKTKGNQENVLANAEHDAVWYKSCVYNDVMFENHIGYEGEISP